MKRNKYIFVFIMLLAVTLAGGIFTMVYVQTQDLQEDEEGLTVVTSFYPVYIAAENVIGHNHDVVLKSLSEPQTGCMHDYQLTPQDMILLSQADVFLVNGGGIESFLTEVAETYPELQIVTVTEELELLEDNAHGWMDTGLYADMVKKMAEGLSKADREHADSYQKNAENYCSKIDSLTKQIDGLKEELKGKKIMIFHEAYEYVAEQYGMEVSYCLDLDEERQVSAGEVADVMKEIQEKGVQVILAEELYGKDMGDTVEQESDARVYFLDSLVRGSYEPDSYLTAMQKNIDIMKEIAGKE